MSDFEERLTTWGTTEAAAIGGPPAFRRRPKRRWLPVAAAAAAVLLVVGGAAWFQSTRVEGGGLPAGTPTPSVSSPVPSPSVLPVAEVPWAALAAGPTISESPLPRPTPDSSLPTCRADELSATDNGTADGAGGTLLRAWVLRNTGSRRCALSGTVDGVSGLIDGQRRDFVLGSGGPPQAPLRPAELSPGDTAPVRWSYYPRCDGPQPSSTPTATHIRLALLGGTVDVAGAGIGFGCDSGLLMSVDQLGQPNEPLTYSVLTLEHLNAAIATTGTLRAGEDNDVVVTLSNPTDADIALEPCPSYLVWTDKTKLQYRLNCAQAHPVPAHGSETFAIKVAVSHDALTGSSYLNWSLLLVARREVFAHAAVTIVGGQDPYTGHEACTFGHANEVPCAKGMVPGKEYPYLLRTHCGLQYLFADGEQWEAEQPLPESDSPEKYARDDDPGFVTLMKPGRVLEYRTSRGVQVVMQPLHTSHGGCD